MAKGSGGTRTIYPDSKTDESSSLETPFERTKNELLSFANSLKGDARIVKFNNVIEGELEISKADIKTIAYKNAQDNDFNIGKNILALDIPNFISNSTFLGWAYPIQGKHPESAYFAYYSRTMNKEFILCLRKMKSSGRFKPYEIIDRKKFNHDMNTRTIYKEKPNK